MESVYSTFIYSRILLGKGSGAARCVPSRALDAGNVLSARSRNLFHDEHQEVRHRPVLGVLHADGLDRERASTDDFGRVVAFELLAVNGKSSLDAQQVGLPAGRDIDRDGFALLEFRRVAIHVLVELDGRVRGGFASGIDDPMPGAAAC